ncbi:MAG: twin-arginine translocase TatA/TatE family subunit [Polyangiales bacterium]
MGELVVIAVVLIIAVGPDKMPTFLKTVVKGIRQFRKTTSDLRESVQIDRILGDAPPVRRAAPAPLSLTEYERQRENPRFGPDVEYAHARQMKHDGEHRNEYPAEGPDVGFAMQGAPQGAEASA